MPVLKDFRRTKTIAVPSYPDSQITVYNSLLAKDADGVMELKENPSAKILLEVLPKFIASWNFTNEQNEPLPITSDNLNFLSEEDLMSIIEEIKKFNDEIKKK